MENLEKAIRLLLMGSSAMINGRYTNSVRDIINQFGGTYELDIIKRGLLEDGSSTYMLLAIGFIEQGRKMLASGMSLPEVIEILEEPIELIKTNDTLDDLLWNIGDRDVVDTVLRYRDRHIILDKGDYEDYIVIDKGYRVPCKAKGGNKDNVKVLCCDIVEHFSQIEDFYGGIVICNEIKREARFTVEQMDITVVEVNNDYFFDLWHLVEADENGVGLASCEVFENYLTIDGKGDLPYIPKGTSDYDEALRAIRRAGSDGAVIIYVGGKTKYDIDRRYRQYQQCLFNLKHYSYGTIEGNGLGFRTTNNVIHRAGIEKVFSGRYGGVDSLYVIEKCISNAKSVAKELISVGAVVN